MSHDQPSSVRILVDTSASIVGHKLNEICETLRQIVGEAPPLVQFDVCVFNSGHKNLFSNKRSFLDVNNLINDINRNCGSASVALYDGLAQTLNEIPYDPTSGVFSLLVISDGLDNSSMVYNVQSVINLLTEKLIRNTNMHLTFIQFGAHSAITRALQTNSTAKFRCSVVIIPSNSSGNSLKLLLYSATQKLITDLKQLSAKTLYQAAFKLRPNYGVGPGLDHKILRQAPQAVTAVVQPQAYQQPQPARQNQNQIKPQARRHQRPHPQLPDSKIFKVWVGNIPMVDQSEVLDYLMQWGPCKLETINGNTSQWAVVAYTTQQAMEFAVKYGNGSTFKGQTININKIS